MRRAVATIALSCFHRLVSHCDRLYYLTRSLLFVSFEYIWLCIVRGIFIDGQWICTAVISIGISLTFNYHVHVYWKRFRIRLTNITRAHSRTSHTSYTPPAPAHRIMQIIPSDRIVWTLNRTFSMRRLKTTNNTLEHSYVWMRISSFRLRLCALSSRSAYNHCAFAQRQPRPTV